MRLSLLVLWAFLAAAALAQQPPSAPSETVQVNLVEIPVNVVDRNGEPVRGLQPENFEVFDEGKRRAITHFEEIDLAELSADPKEVHNPAARRNFLLVFDLTHSTPKTIERARDAASEFVEDALRERDLVSVATFGVENGFRIHTAFTTDRSLVRQAIQTLGSVEFYQPRDPLLLSMSTDPGLERGQQRMVTGGAQLGAMEIQDVVRQRMEMAGDQYFRDRIERQVESFSAMARVLDAIRGRKHVILLSEGFKDRLVQGKSDPKTNLQREEEMLAQARGEIWRIDNDSRFGSVTTLNRLDQMTAVFRRSDVVLHAIDIHGVPGTSDARTGQRSASNETLFMMSHPTGGTVLKHSNDLGESFRRLLRQQEVIYILGFQTTPSGEPGRYHDLAVKVKVVGHRGLQVSHRAGYYEPRLQMSVVEQRLSATDILMNDIPFNDVAIDLLAAPFPLDAERSQVPVIAEIDGAGLVGASKSEQLNLELFVYAFDNESRVRDFLFQTVSVDLAQLRGALRSSGIKYYGTLALPPGEYTIKSLVRVVENGRNGFERVRLRVPERGAMALLPPLLFEDAGKWIMLKGAKTAEGQIDYPFMLAEESFIPSAHPVVASGEAYKLALFTRNVTPEEIEITGTVESADGTRENAPLKLLGRTSRDEHGTVKLLMSFEPTDLSPGEYALHLTARQRSDGEFREVSLPFRVRGEGVSR